MKNANKKMVARPLEKTFCEFFAGIGLVREGLEPSGWRCVYANDISPKKQRIYEARFGRDAHFDLRDVWKAGEVLDRIPGHPALATACFPCIDLSLAGHYRGLDGEYSSTFFGFLEILHLLGERRPPMVLVENVTGFLTSRKGQDFATAAVRLSDLGYWLDVFVLDASHFTPQSRPRVFLVGVAQELCPSENGAGSQNWLFPEEEPSLLRPRIVVQAKQRVELRTGWVTFPLPAPQRRNINLADVIDLDENQDWWADDEVSRHYKMMSDLHRDQVDQIRASGKKWVGTIFRRIRHNQMRAEVRFDGLAGCLRTPKGGSAKQIVIAIDSGTLHLRWMNAREYARLQGAPNFPLTGSWLDQLWGFADAVCVPAISWIDENLLTPVFEAALRSDRNSHARQLDARTMPQNNAGGKKEKQVAEVEVR